MDVQLTVRLPAGLARQLAARIRRLGVTRSHLVREALEHYLAAAEGLPPSVLEERAAPYLGALRLDPAAAEQDDLARQLRQHNWRE